jgi:hypothetical protein
MLSTACWHLYVMWNVFVLLSCVIYSTACCELQEVDYNLKECTFCWQTTETKCHSKCGHCLYTLMSGTRVNADWGRGRTTVLWAVAHCRHGHRGAFYLNLMPLWRQKLSLKDCYCYTRLHGITNQKTVIYRRTSGLIRCLRSLHDAHGPKESPDKGVCHVKFRFVLLVNWNLLYHLVCL